MATATKGHSHIKLDIVSDLKKVLNMVKEYVKVTLSGDASAAGIRAEDYTTLKEREDNKSVCFDITKGTLKSINLKLAIAQGGIDGYVMDKEVKIVESFIKHSFSYWTDITRGTTSSCIPVIDEVVRMYASSFFNKKEMDSIKGILLYGYKKDVNRIEAIRKMLKSIVQKMILYIHFNRKPRWLDSNGTVVKKENNNVVLGDATNKGCKVRYTVDTVFPQIDVKQWSRCAKVTLPVPNLPYKIR